MVRRNKDGSISVGILDEVKKPAVKDAGTEEPKEAPKKPKKAVQK